MDTLFVAILVTLLSNLVAIARRKESIQVLVRRVVEPLHQTIQQKQQQQQQQKHQEGSLESAQRELVSLHEHLAKLSPQDQYVEWTKTNRKIAKLVPEIERLKEHTVQSTQQMSRRVGQILVAAMLALRVFNFVYFRGEHALWVPKAHFPTPVLYLLAFPRNPLGCVSYSFFLYATNVVIGQIIAAFTPIVLG